VRPFKEWPQTETGPVKPSGWGGRYFRASGHEYGRWPEEGATESGTALAQAAIVRERQRIEADLGTGVLLGSRRVLASRVSGGKISSMQTDWAAFEVNGEQHVFA
jgi:hypothetical protein